MGETPSNYYHVNGRPSGKNMGLRAILQHAQKHTGVMIDGLGSSPLAAKLSNATPDHKPETQRFVSGLAQKMATALKYEDAPIGEDAFRNNNNF